MVIEAIVGTCICEEYTQSHGRMVGAENMMMFHPMGEQDVVRVVVVRVL